MGTEYRIIDRVLCWTPQSARCWIGSTQRVDPHKNQSSDPFSLRSHNHLGDPLDVGKILQAIFVPHNLYRVYTVEESHVPCPLYKCPPAHMGSSSTRASPVCHKPILLSQFHRYGQIKEPYQPQPEQESPQKRHQEGPQVQEDELQGNVPSFPQKPEICFEGYAKQGGTRVGSTVIKIHRIRCPQRCRTVSSRMTSQDCWRLFATIRPSPLLKMTTENAN